MLLRLGTLNQDLKSKETTDFNIREIKESVNSLIFFP